MSPHAMSRGSAVARQRQTATPARRTLSLRGILNRRKKNRRRSKVRQAAGGCYTAQEARGGAQVYGEQSENRVVRAMSLEFLENENTPKTARPKHAQNTHQARVLMLDPAGYCFDLRVIVLCKIFRVRGHRESVAGFSQDRVRPTNLGS